MELNRLKNLNSILGSVTGIQQRGQPSFPNHYHYDNTLTKIKDTFKMSPILLGCQEIVLVLGVPQARVIGPVLFLLYINDIARELNCSIRLFADECMIYRQVSNIHECEMLQMSINKIAFWKKCWQMT